MEKESNKSNDIATKVSWTFVIFSTMIFLVMTGVNFISLIPPHGEFLYALSLMGTSVYFTMKILETWELV